MKLWNCHGTFGDRSPYLEHAYQYANTDNNYVDVDPRWRRKDRIDEYYYLIGINKWAMVKGIRLKYSF